MTDINSPHRADRCRGRRRCHADARSDVARAGRRAALRPAGARLVSLQGRRHRGDGRDRRREPVQVPGRLYHQQGREQINAALAAAYLQPAPDMIAIPYCPCAVQHRLAAGRHRHRHRRGELQEQQGRRRAVPRQPEGAGIDRNQVDVVVISHFHGDHINGLLTPDNKPAFPNAEIMVPAPEWKYFTDDGEMSRADHRSHERRVRRLPPRVRRARPQGHAV